ncbi:MAG: Sir2 family NAD-dependent protein deacetylase [Microbacteriaceae bacterium]
MVSDLFSTEDEMLIQEAINLLQNRRFAVLTGAGVSTDSGIPDYRSPGTVHRTPMTIQRFLESEESYRRYWAGSYLGWSTMQSFKPNTGHLAIAALEHGGLVNHLLTQNVDSLHEKAGSQNVIHLHGSMEKVRCLQCGHTFPRTEVETWLKRDNSQTVLHSSELRPDGDAEVQVPKEFIAPHCPLCTGRLKPDVIYFGEVMLPETNTRAKLAIDEAEALLVAGSSLAVNSGHRMVVRAQRDGKPVVIVNRGDTQGDRYASLKIELGVSEVLSALSERLLI